MKRVFLQMLSCCEHISNCQILIKGDFDNDIRSLLTSNYEAMLCFLILGGLMAEFLKSRFLRQEFVQCNC